MHSPYELHDADLTHRSLPVETLKSLIMSLLSMLPEDSSPRALAVKSELPSPTAVRPNGTKVTPAQPVYDPAFVCLTELATVLAIRDEETIESFGREVAGVLQTAIREADHLHPVSVSRLSYYLLKLLRASNVSPPPPK